MAKTNQTYYNKKDADFSGMFDAGQEFTPVDWSTITIDLVDKIAVETKRRETKKADIQTKTDDLITDLRDYQSGANQTFNGYVLDGSTQVKDYMLMQNKLMQNGKLDPNKYVRSTQLLQDDWNSFQTAVETFNADYAAAVEKANTGDLSALGDMSFNGMQEAVNIQKSRIVISPDGRMYSQNGKGDLVGFGTLNGRQKDLPMNWNVQKEVKDGFTADIGKTVEAFGTMTVESAIQSDDFKSAEASYIEGIIGSLDSPNGTGREFLSILTQNGYSLTQDEEIAKGDPKKIFVKTDANGLLQPVSKYLYTAKNIKVGKEILQDAIRSQLDYIEKPGGLISVSERIYNLGKKDKIDALDDVYALVAGLSSGDANDSKSALVTLANQFGAIDRVKNIKSPAGHNTGISITLSTGAQPVDIMFETPGGDRKTRQQITAELFPIFHAGKLGTSQFAEIEAKYLDSLGDNATIFSNNAYQTPLLQDGDEGPFGLNFERRKQIPRFDVTEITIGGKKSGSAAGDHSDAIKELLKTDADDKDDKIKALNNNFMHELKTVLTFTEKDGEDFKTGSLDLEMDEDGSIVVVTPDGITHVIVNSLTGDVNLNQLQELINARQVRPGTVSGGSGGAMSKY